MTRICLLATTSRHCRGVGFTSRQGDYPECAFSWLYARHWAELLTVAGDGTVTGFHTRTCVSLELQCSQHTRASRVAPLLSALSLQLRRPIRDQRQRRVDGFWLY